MRHLLCEGRFCAPENYEEGDSRRIPSAMSNAFLITAPQKATLEKAAKGEIERPSERRAAQMQQVRKPHAPCMYPATLHIVEQSGTKKTLVP